MGLIVFSIGGIPVYLYGGIVMLAILAGILAAWINVRLHGEDFAPMVDVLLAGLPAGLIMARLGYVLGHWPSYAEHWSDIPCFWQGGLSLYGGMAGFLLVLWVYSRYFDMDIWYWLDLLVPALILCLAIDQVGRFASQMTVGMPLPHDLPNDHTLAEYIEYRYRPSGFENYEYFRPVALYQAFLQLVVFVFAILLTFWQSQRHFLVSGGIFLLSVVLLALVRCGCGFLYLTTAAGFSIHIGQIMSLLAAGAALGVFAWRRRCRRDWRI